MRLLLVEDDPNLGQATMDGLHDVFAIDWVRSAEEALETLSTTRYDLMIFDINLPGMSGIDFLKSRRGVKDKTPVLMLTARDAVRHKIEGLNAGADDYMIKPFDLDELIARCSALIRRATGSMEAFMQIGDVRYEPSSGKLEKSGQLISLSGKEKAILDVLMHNIDRPVSKNMIEERIYDWTSADIESNTIEVHVASIRRKAGRDLIKTIRGVGYMICRP